jgi:hypothetical protein
MVSLSNHEGRLLATRFCDSGTVCARARQNAGELGGAFERPQMRPRLAPIIVLAAS